jgi:hypothetical protein
VSKLVNERLHCRPMRAWAVCIAVAGLLFASGAAQAWVTETPAEFIAEGDFDGDGRIDVAIVDKVSGAYRIAYQPAAGTTAWSESRASGILDVTGVSIGRVLNTTRDTLVVTGPDANRANLLEALNATAPALPVAVYLPSIGPNAVAAIDIGGAGNTGHADLYIASRENPGPRETLVRNTGASRSLIADNAVSRIRASFNAIQLKTSDPLRLGFFNRLNPGGNDGFGVLDLTSGSAIGILSLVVPLPNASRPEFISARFNNADPLAQVLFFQPGGSNLLKYQVQEPVPGSFSLGGSNSFGLGSPIQQVQLVPSAADTRLLVLFGSSSTSATVAAVFTFDGVNPPVRVFSATNDAGFTAGAALDGGNFTLLSGDGSGRSTSFANWLASGGSYVAGASGALPSITAHSGGANVVMFNGEPFVLPAARALKSLRAREWSSSAQLSGGVPPNVTVSGEIYVNASNGLANPTSVALGTAPASTTHVLVNQYTNPISIFPRRSAIGEVPAEVSVTPPPGPYTEAIHVALTVNVPLWSIQYRLAPSAAWQTYSSPITLFSNATVQFYARNLAGTKTSIQNAAYTFSIAANSIDSDGDGVPDFVEAAQGIDPLNSGPDADGDGYSDLEELVRGTDPLNKFHAPTNFPRVDFRQAFDLLTTVRSPNVAGNSTLSLTGVVVRSHGLDGSTFVQGETATQAPLPSGATNPAARLVQVLPTDGESLVVQSTDQHFDLNVTGDTRIGREVVGLVPVPPHVLPTLPPVNIALGAGADEAWISAAANIITNVPRTLVVGDLTWRDTLVAALVEAKIAEILVARGTNFGTNLTLFPFRVADAGRQPASLAELFALESYAGPTLPAYRLTNIFVEMRDSIEFPAVPPDVNELRALTAVIYQLSAAHNNTNPATLKLPLDELRYFFQNGTLDSGYLAFYGGTINFANAWAGYSNLLAGIQPRPTTNVLIEVVNSGPGITTTFQIAGSGTPVTLWQSDGTPCPLPPTFNVIPGSRLSLFGHNDVPPFAPGLAVEVISVTFASVPIASDPDMNGNLLIDSWEGVFFGSENADAFADADGDGYTNLQEMLSGSDPYNPSNVPAAPPVNFAQPVLDLKILPGQTSLNFSWPAAYIGQFKFGVRASETVGGMFSDLVVGPPVHLGGDNFALNFTLPAVQHQFYYVTVALNQ